MARLAAWCVVALLALGLAVGCWDGTHRESRMEVHELAAGGFAVEYFCRCGRRPYAEVYR